MILPSGKKEKEKKKKSCVVKAINPFNVSIKQTKRYPSNLW
jgi:hypothetical protein